MEKVSIYTLVDPRDGTVRYVGMSNNPQKRLQQHYSGGYAAAAAVKDWIRELRALETKPLLFIVEEVDNYDTAWRRETYWINFFLAEGEPLVNWLSEDRKQFYSTV